MERKEGIKKSMKEVKRKTVKERWKGRKLKGIKN